MTAKKESKSPEDEEISYEPESEAGDLDEALKKIGKLKKELAQCRKERQEYLNGWQRMRADVANRQKGEGETRKRAHEAAKIELAEQLLPVVDSFDMAFRGSEWQKTDETWRRGIEQIHSQLLKVLKKWGIESFGAIGDTFDPALHEATSEEYVDEKEKDGTLANVLQKGYKMGDTIIRPARVAVARASR